MEVPNRVRGLQACLDSAGCDALLVSHLTNVRYLTGFTGSSGYLWVGPTSVSLITDGRYDEQARGELHATGVMAEVIIGHTSSAIRQALSDHAEGVRNLGIEAEHVSWAEQGRYVDDVFPSTTLVPSSGLVEALRAVKDRGEVARIEAACAIADAALGAVAPGLEHRPTEAAFALELDAAMRTGGADAVSFDTIVASGPLGSRPHHMPSGRVIERGDLVVIDFGAMIDGYHSDMTRTIAVGGSAALDATQRRMMTVVGEAQAAGVAAVAAGVSTTAVDTACREVIAAAGWAEAFVHGTGHGVGLDIHEAPRVAATDAATLLSGHVVTVEPGVYLPGHGGVRIEDTVVVTESGCRTLTRAPKS
ncbi:MAG: aminopeptidase P family protein [Acidimicrobiia bacterium]|nr:aminopeptidase P family protein [Acidimicrobiia bacterium]